MRFYINHHQHYCGIDLHTKTMYMCILDSEGTILFHENAPVNADVLVEIIEPYLPDIVICVECIFTWYWIADFCEERDIPFVLGHALYMKANESESFVLMEQWKSRKDLSRFVESDEYKQVLFAMDLCKEMPQIQFFKVNECPIAFSGHDK